MPFDPMSSTVPAAFSVPIEHGASGLSLPANEPMRGYAPGSPERTSLTAAVERMAASDALRDAAGNLYVNDKPTGAVVGQQPFGGGRRSGTNDKAGSPWNLLRWVLPRTIKETPLPPTNYRYPSMAEDPAQAA